MSDILAAIAYVQAEIRAGRIPDLQYNQEEIQRLYDASISSLKPTPAPAPRQDFRAWD